MTEPKPVVLPLHHDPIASAKVRHFSQSSKFYFFFFIPKTKIRGLAGETGKCDTMLFDDKTHGQECCFLALSSVWRCLSSACSRFFCYAELTIWPVLLIFLFVVSAFQWKIMGCMLFLQVYGELFFETTKNQLMNTLFQTLSKTVFFKLLEFKSQNKVVQGRLPNK